jgi:hypothetical protein
MHRFKLTWFRDSAYGYGYGDMYFSDLWSAVVMAASFSDATCWAVYDAHGNLAGWSSADAVLIGGVVR